jgi:hypothetical protein
MSKEQLRQQMPTVAQIVDELRPLLANGGKLIYASENGHVIDRREPEENVFDIPPGYRTPYEPKVKK